MLAHGFCDNPITSRPSNTCTNWKLWRCTGGKVFVVSLRRGTPFHSKNSCRMGVVTWKPQDFSWLGDSLTEAGQFVLSAMGARPPEAEGRTSKAAWPQCYLKLERTSFGLRRGLSRQVTDWLVAKTGAP